MAILVQSNKKPSVTFPSQTGDIITFNSQFAGLPLKSCVVDFEDETGISSLDFSATGVNLWNEEYLNGYYDRNNQGAFVSNSSFFCSKDFITVLPNMQLFWYAESSQQGRILFYDANGNYISATEATAPNTVITVPRNAYKMHFYIFKDGGTTMFNVSINYPSSDTIYHSGTSNHNKLFTFGKTIQNGSLNVITGELTNNDTTPPEVINLGGMDISTLQGENNLFASTGETTAEYIKIGG